MRLGFRALLLILVGWGPAGGPSVSEYVRSREDVARGVRSRVEQTLRAKLKKAAKDRETNDRKELGTVKSVVAAGFFLGADPRKIGDAAVGAHRLVLDHIPPPLAFQYQWLTLLGQVPQRTALEMALDFPKTYSEELAPDVVSAWEAAVQSGTLPDELLEPTMEALKETRARMRPLLLDKLRLLARLAREHPVSSGVRRAEIEADMRAIEEELSRSFVSVASRPEIIDAKKPPYDRLRMELEDEGIKPTEEDRYLDPSQPPPPRRPVPIEEEPAVPDPSVNAPLVEPNAPPPPRPPPDQPRPGEPVNEKAGRAELFELTEAYKNRLTRTMSSWLGTPFELGGAREQAGTDAPGFVRAIFLDGFAVDLPRTASDQYRVGQSVPKASIRPGDLLFFDINDDGRVDHVGISMDAGKWAHAHPTKGVILEKLSEKRYARSYRGARRALFYPAPDAP